MKTNRMRIKTENVEESIEPVDVDKAGSKASEEETDGLSKMLGYSKVCVYRSVHISTRGFVSVQYKCTEFLDPVTIWICPEKIYTELIIYIYIYILCSCTTDPRKVCAP